MITMKKFHLTALFVTVFSLLFSQVPVYDSAQLNTDCSEMVFYNLDNGHKTTASNTDWDLAITVRATQFPSAPLGGTTIRINKTNGADLYLAPNTGASGFATLDTTNFRNWRKLHDSDTAMDEGALNSIRNHANIYDFGWGKYNSFNHHVIGDSVFVVALTNGSVFKLMVDSLLFDTMFVIRFSNIDNSNAHTVYINKKNYQGKNFVYLNVSTATVMDKEPLSIDWDLLFLKYAGVVEPDSTYLAVGVWQNMGLSTAKRIGVEVADNNVGSFSFSDNLNTVGWDWKFYNSLNSAYEVFDSTAYFVQKNSGGYFKIVFTGFSGVNDGIIRFYRNVLTTGIDEAEKIPFRIFPNPANSQINISDFSIPEKSEIRISDLSGRTVYTNTLHNNSIDVSQLTSGVYLLTVISEKGIAVKKFAVNRQ